MAVLAKNIICRKCNKNIDPLELFPGQICFDCHANKFKELWDRYRQKKVRSGAMAIDFLNLIS